MELQRFMFSLKDKWVRQLFINRMIALRHKRIEMSTNVQNWIALSLN